MNFQICGCQTDRR